MASPTPLLTRYFLLTIPSLPTSRSPFTSFSSTTSSLWCGRSTTPVGWEIIIRAWGTWLCLPVHSCPEGHCPMLSPLSAVAEPTALCVLQVHGGRRARQVAAALDLHHHARHAATLSRCVRVTPSLAGHVGLVTNGAAHQPPAAAAARRRVPRGSSSSSRERVREPKRCLIGRCVSASWPASADRSGYESENARG